MHYACFERLPGKMHSIETDGRKITSNREPAGQKCVYITPGNPVRETYRLSTFQHFPRDSPVDPRQCAANGFYFTGYRDRIKCFSCGQNCDNWMLGDDITSSEWHHPNCDFINGRDETNQPIMALLRQRQLQRQNLPANRDNSSPVNHFQRRSLSGANYNQESIATSSTTFPKSISSNTPLPSNDVSRALPQTAQLVNQPISRQQILFSTPSLTSNEVNSSPANFRTLFPCLHSVNPHMRSREARMQTFLDHSTVWPAHRIRASPQQIVDAGFFYLGNRDRVKCWYCNGGLQNWERDDVPWEEHAKWFPMCEYVLQQKGPSYVHEIVSRFPNLRRPILTNAASGQAAGALRQSLPSVSSQMNFESSTSGNERTSPPIIIDPRKEMFERNQKIDHEMRTSDKVMQARMMGFEDDAIKMAIKRKYQTDNQSFSNFHDLVEAILLITDGESIGETHELPALQPTTSISNASSSSPFQELKRLEDSRRCKKCRNEDACVVFIPCGHLVCCEECAKKSKKCPACKEFVRERVRSYIS